MAEKNANALTTDELAARLSATGDLRRFVKRYQSCLGTQSLNEYLHEQCKNRGLLAGDVIKRANIDKSYGYLIFQGKRSPSRDIVIQLAFGLGLDAAETQHMLTLANKPQLYVKILREMTILYCLENHVSLVDTQLMLQQMNLEIIGGAKND